MIAVTDRDWGVAAVDGNRLDVTALDGSGLDVTAFGGSRPWTMEVRV